MRLADRLASQGGLNVCEGCQPNWEEDRSNHMLRQLWRLRSRKAGHASHITVWAASDLLCRGGSSQSHNVSQLDSSQLDHPVSYRISNKIAH